MTSLLENALDLKAGAKIRWEGGDICPSMSNRVKANKCELMVPICLSNWPVQVTRMALPANIGALFGP